MVLSRQGPVDQRPRVDLGRRDFPRRQPSVERIGWIEWATALVLLVAVTAAVVFLSTIDDSPDAAPVLASGRDSAAVPEYLGASGGDLAVVESSPLVLGARHDGFALIPEFVGASGGDRPVDEASALALGPRHGGTVAVPAYLGSSGEEVPTRP